jgi:pimeloyl-ACP methyl ester carboxylesterase
MLIKRWLPLVALLCLQTPALAAHSGSAPTDPSKPDDEHFIVDTDTGLDTGCTGRDGSPLVFKVKINRYVGEINADGTLKEPQKLIDNKVISPTAKLKMPAYDIDFEQGEIDKVFFNGHELSRPLTGTNETWNENEFEIPIQWVKFPARGSMGENGSPPSSPQAAENEIRIDIDPTNEGWCASIDWAELNFKAMHPLLLIHGTGDNPEDCWEKPGVTQHLASLGVPFEHKIQLEPNGRILPELDRQGNPLPNNAQALAGYVRTIAQSFGVQKVHLVAHSKGGLDSRGYLRRFYNPEQLRVLSLHTLSSPHWGTVLSDISVRARNARRTGEPPVAQQGDRDMEVFLYYDSLVAFSGQGPQSPALDVQQTAAMRGFNQEIGAPPNDVKFYTYGADADLNGDGDIDNRLIRKWEIFTRIGF